VLALVFDFDGLIMDTETPEYEVWKEIFAEHGVAMPDGFWTQVIGRGAEQEIERPPQLLARLCPGVDANEAHESARRRIRERIEHLGARPGIVSLLDEAERDGVRLAVASSSRHEWVDRKLEKLNLMHRFQHVICADDTPRAKPFPDLYLLACERLGVSPSQAVALEDSPNGIAAAKAAGLFVVAVPNSVTIQLDLSEADAQVDDMASMDLEGLRQLKGPG
jgi:HAD superfamily hydrolase (TIGR01509 family)